MDTKKLELKLACEKLAYAIKLGKVLPTQEVINKHWKEWAKKSTRKYMGK